MRYCPNCGAPCEEDALFCEACGTDLREDAALQEESVLREEPVLQEGTVLQAEPPESGREPENGGNGSKEQGKNKTVLIVAAAALVVAIIAGTAFGVSMIKRGGEKQEQQTAALDADGKEDGKEEDTEEKTENPASDTQEKASDTQEKDSDAELKPTIAPFEEETDADGEQAEEPEEENADPGENVAGADSGGNTELKPTIPPLEEEPASEAQSDYETYYVVNCKESITLRKSASTKAGEYCQIPLGAAVSFVEKAENGFYKVIYNGTTGYALASYLAPEGGGSSEAGSRMVVVNCKESITLRKTPSTSGEEFCQIPLGAEVEYLGTAENGFYTVKYNGFTGYALASYLEWAS